MDTGRIIKESKLVMFAGLVLGILLLGLGVSFSIMDLDLVPNNKALIGLSFMPLGVALVYYLKLIKIKKSPQQMKSIIIYENDERLVAMKNKADAMAFRMTQALLFLGYMGYTLMIPEDIFESIGWWILLGLLMFSYMSQGLLRASELKKEKSSSIDS